MNRQHLLRDIAETGYNVGFGAKKHFATHDMVVKLPSIIALFTMAIGIFGLIFHPLTLPVVSASVLILGLIALGINTYQDTIKNYDAAGVSLTKYRDELRGIYRTVQSKSDNEDLSALISRYNEIARECKDIGISKQILLSNWYAHYKFFAEDQVQWIDEQLNFTLRDKIPLSFRLALLLPFVSSVIFVVYAWCNGHFAEWTCLS